MMQRTAGPLLGDVVVVALGTWGPVDLDSEAPGHAYCELWGHVNWERKRVRGSMKERTGDRGYAGQARRDNADKKIHPTSESDLGLTGGRGA
jgi:hypothetical protein